MTADPLDVDWGWYNTLVALLGFLPFLAVLLVGPTLLTRVAAGVDVAGGFRWGMVAGMFAVGLWVQAIRRYTRTGTVDAGAEAE